MTKDPRATRRKAKKAMANDKEILNLLVQSSKVDVPDSEKEDQIINRRRATRMLLRNGYRVRLSNIIMSQLCSKSKGYSREKLKRRRIPVTCNYFYNKYLMMWDNALPRQLLIRLQHLFQSEIDRGEGDFPAYRTYWEYHNYKKRPLSEEDRTPFFSYSFTVPDSRTSQAAATCLHEFALCVLCLARREKWLADLEHRRDARNAIQKGDEQSWRVEMVR